MQCSLEGNRVLDQKLWNAVEQAYEANTMTGEYLRLVVRDALRSRPAPRSRGWVGNDWPTRRRGRSKSTKDAADSMQSTMRHGIYL